MTMYLNPYKRLRTGWPRLSGKTHTHVWRNLKNWRTSNYFIILSYQNRPIIFLVQDIFRFLKIPLNKIYSGWLCTTVSGTTGAVLCSRVATSLQSKWNLFHFRDFSVFDITWFVGSSIAPENKKFDVIGCTHYNAKAEVFCPDMFTVSIVTIISTTRVCIGSPSLSEGSPKSQVP